MTIKELYQEIANLTAKIAATGVGMKLVEAGKTGDDRKVEEVYEAFLKENAELYQSIKDFKQAYAAEESPCIFVSEDADEEVFDYDPEEIDPFNISILFALSDIEDDDALYDTSVFSDTDVLYDALKASGHEKIATYMAETYIHIDSFVEIFAN